MHKLLLHNGRIVPTSERGISPGQVGFLNGWGVFSTIRVVDGVLFAFERHWARMSRDAELLHVPMPARDAFHADLLRLINANDARNATLRTAVVRNRGGFFEGEGIESDFDVVAFTTGLNRWGESVALGVQADARHGSSPFAGTKVTSWVQNLTFLENARAQGYDEVVLLDEHGRVSECTSANIFAEVRTGEVYTPPLFSGCLPGVTRAILLEEIRADQYEIREKHLSLDDLYAAPSVFITSTTRELLPVAAIAGRPLLRTGNAAWDLQAAFSSYMRAYAAKTSPVGTH
ncbi:MAG: aminotransferase class IV [Bryobacteraceae bacterium]